MKEDLVRVFMFWINKHGIKTIDNVEYIYYPNLIRGMDYIFDHCACVHTFKSTDIHMHIFDTFFDKFYYSQELKYCSPNYFGTIREGMFTILVQDLKLIPHPNGEALRNTTIKSIDFKPILEHLVRHTFERIRDEDIEAFLIGATF